MSEESKQRSFWDRLFSIEYHSAREERVIEYITHRLHDGGIWNSTSAPRNSTRVDALADTTPQTGFRPPRLYDFPVTKRTMEAAPLSVPAVFTVKPFVKYTLGHRSRSHH
jgi:hypothetical protein